MKWKKLGKEGKQVSVKEKMFQMFSPTRGLKKKDSNVPSSTPEFNTAWYVPSNFLARTRLEAELKKEEALVYWNNVMRSRAI
jgi:hypothetical protein